jgi:1-deoxyxylulose-5-phosphate synthase
LRRLLGREAPRQDTGMAHVRLGTSGLKVPRLCLGTMSFGPTAAQPWALAEDEARPIVHRALELGVTFFDTADVYSNGASEEILGRALHEAVPRDRVVIATKVHGPVGPGANDRGLSRKHIVGAIEASLRRLRTDYVDLYQVHRWDPECPIEETLGALHDVVRSGKARYLGASSMFAWQFCTALHVADRRGWPRFVSMQNHYNLVYREEEREMLPLCRAEGIGVLPWSPLAKGLLAGNRGPGGAGPTLRARTDEYAQRLYAHESDAQVVTRVGEVARRRGVTPAQVALSWLLAQPAVTAPVVGVTRIGQLEEAVAALGIRLEPQECARLAEPYRPHPVLGHS